MTIKGHILDGAGKGVLAKVSSAGELAVGPVAYNMAATANAIVADTAYNLIGPRAGKNAIITAMLVSTDKDVSATVEASIEIYAATGAEITTVSESLFSFGLIRLDKVALSGLYLQVEKGRYVNIKTTDAGLRATLLYYYI